MLPIRTPRPRTFLSALAALLGLIVPGLVAAPAPAQAATVTIANGTQFTDTTGAVVHAHGGGVTSRVQLLWAGSKREAPAMFKRGGVYFLLTSAATGWSPNQQWTRRAV